MPLTINIPRVWVWSHISKKSSSTYMPLGKCFGPAAQQRSLKDGRWSGKSDPNLPSPPTTTQFQLRNYVMNETHISWEKDQFIPNWQSFNESRKSRSWIKIAQMTMCEGDAMTWRVEMHSKFYVRTLHLPLRRGQPWHICWGKCGSIIYVCVRPL